MQKKSEVKVHRLSLSKKDFAAALDRASNNVNSWAACREAPKIGQSATLSRTENPPKK